MTGDENKIIPSNKNEDPDKLGSRIMDKILRGKEWYFIYIVKNTLSSG